jgi:glycosyltransferase involved in cell wall biosynthesis
MNAVHLLVPGKLDTLTGGYGYDRQMAAGLRQRGWAVDVHELDGSFPYPTAAARMSAAGVLAAVPNRATVLIDGLALGVLPDEVWDEASRLRIVALVHHPLAEETGIEPHIARRFEESERRALAAVRLVIVTSRGTAEGLAQYGVGANRLVVVEPGTNRGALARGSGGGPHQLLCVASIVPRKGHEVLIRALADVPRSDWLLTCVGSTTRSAATMQSLSEQIEEESLGDHVRFVGEVEGPMLDRYYDEADFFVLPTRHEGYGMAVAEALARGIPVISTPTGAIADLVGRDAGMLVPPDDFQALTATLWRVMEDETLRARLREGARKARERLPGWEQQVDKMAVALARVAADDGRL